MADPRSTLNRARFAGADFDSILDELLVRLQARYGQDYNDFAQHAQGMMLLDLQAFGGDTSAFYLDRRAAEAYLVTARTRKGVSRVSRGLGYKMAGAVAAATDLSVQVKTPLSLDVSLPVGFQWQGPNDSVFEVVKAVTFTAAEQVAGTTKSVSIAEGETVSESFVSSGQANQVFELRAVPDGKSPASGTVTCFVDGAEYEEADLLDYGDTEQFEVAFNDSPPSIRFGDGVVGKIPTKNATITVTYLATSGKLGEAAAGSITEPVTALVVAGQSVDFLATNLLRAGGGDDRESLEQTRTFAGRVFASRRKAITTPDYLALAGSFASPVYGRVAVAQAISARSAAEDLYLQSRLATIASSLDGPVTTLRDLVAEAADSSSSTSTLVQITTALGDDSTQVLGAAEATASSVTTLDSGLDAVLATLRALRNTTLEIDNQVAAGEDKVEDLTDEPVTATINAYFDDIGTKSGSIRSSLEAVLATLGALKDETDKIGSSTSATQTDGSASYVKVIADQVAVVQGLVGEDDVDDPSSATGLYLVFNSEVAGVADALDPSSSGDNAEDIAVALQEVFDHVDSMLAADCQANLVSVPILVRDAAGFYVAPSLGLIDALQAYLDERKEPTQTVSVVSGASFLRYPWLTLRVGVLKGYSLDKARAGVEAAVDGLLRGRPFGLSLYVSDIWDVVRQVPGVSFANIEILGHTTATDSVIDNGKLDVDGNLIIDVGEVLTKTPGSVSISTELVLRTPA